MRSSLSSGMILTNDPGLNPGFRATDAGIINPTTLFPNFKSFVAINTSEFVTDYSTSGAKQPGHTLELPLHPLHRYHRSGFGGFTFAASLVGVAASVSADCTPLVGLLRMSPESKSRTST